MLLALRGARVLVGLLACELEALASLNAVFTNASAIHSATFSTTSPILFYFCLAGAFPSVS